MGRLGQDPKLSYTPSGRAVLKFSLATTETWKDKGGKRSERTDWHDVEFWGKGAEVIAKFVRKGSLLYLRGQMRNQTWEKNGETKQRTVVVATDVNVVGPGSMVNQYGANQGGAGLDAGAPPADESDIAY
jgi:single-strand DNA-binding protein